MALDLTRIARERGVDLRAWPPKYDAAYRPRPDEQFWLPRWSARGRRAGGADPRKAARAGALGLGESRSTAASGRRRGSLPTRCGRSATSAASPWCRRTSCARAQAAHPPFGDYLCIDPAEVARIHGTSGTTGRPTVFGIGRDDWGRIAEAHARILLGAGIRPRDRVMICSFFSLYMGSWAR